VALEAKLEQAHGPFWPDVERLAREFSDHESSAEVPGGIEALARGLAALPVYRTYVEPGFGQVASEDRAAIETAVASGMNEDLAQMLLLEREAPDSFIRRFQQTSPAIMAKGVEDTAFYRYSRLLALNDVGGSPARFGIEVGHFHAGNIERSQRFPLNLLTTQTHDAKRSADVRARIVALASMPSEWASHVVRWLEVTEGLRAGGAPDDAERYFIFQTLLGAWPIEPSRMKAYVEKALREAKRNTNWIEQNREWESAALGFCSALYSYAPFLEDFEPFAARVADAAERIALGQVVLKLTAPGIPDIYQGDELPFRALVDPDNRRPVDWDWHQAMLRRLMGGSPPDRDTYKLFLTLRLLGLRARRPEPFGANGSYRPLDAGSNVCAYLRGDDVLVLVAARAGPVGGTLEPVGGSWRDVLVGEERSLGGGASLRSLVGAHGFGVFERL
jgi:(1->4)-alpha-D-glucan 1-alpha-D-glucosylmutase